MSKTATNEVRCDGCGAMIPLALSGSPALQMTLRGQSVGHLKADFCHHNCLARWAERWNGGGHTVGSGEDCLCGHGTMACPLHALENILGQPGNGEGYGDSATTD